MSTKATTTGISPAAGRRPLSKPTDHAAAGDLEPVVDAMLKQLETRVAEKSEQLLQQMGDMTGRIDLLDAAIKDLQSSGV